jgi:hypothetical protein
VNTFIPLDKIDSIDLQDYHEVWLTTSETWPQDPATVHRKCLWRQAREMTQDVEIDGVYFENLPHLWLRVDDLDDQQDIDLVIKKLQARIGALGLEGEFNPAELPTSSVPHKDEDEINKDLRS